MKSTIVCNLCFGTVYAERAKVIDGDDVCNICVAQLALNEEEYLSENQDITNHLEENE